MRGRCSKGMRKDAIQTCDFSIIASRLSLDLHADVGVFLRACCVLLEHLLVGLLLGDCF